MDSSISTGGVMLAASWDGCAWQDCTGVQAESVTEQAGNIVALSEATREWRIQEVRRLVADSRDCLQLPANVLRERMRVDTLYALRVKDCRSWMNALHQRSRHVAI